MTTWAIIYDPKVTPHDQQVRKYRRLSTTRRLGATIHDKVGKEIKPGDGRRWRMAIYDQEIRETIHRHEMEGDNLCPCDPHTDQVTRDNDL